MWLSRFWARVSQFTRPRRARGLRGIYSVEQFRTILERERARADRNGHQFSMIIFETGNPDQDSPQIQRLAQTLVKRIRSGDEAGWFDGHRIAVVLPETSADGAWRLADDICQAITTKTSPPEYTVYTYPSEWFSDEMTIHPSSISRIYPLNGRRQRCGPCLGLPSTAPVNFRPLPRSG